VGETSANNKKKSPEDLIYLRKEDSSFSRNDKFELRRNDIKQREYHAM